MADYAPNWTGRVKLRYSSAGAVHSLTVRAPRSATLGMLSGYADHAIAVLNALAPARWSDWTLLGVTGAVADSDIFFPVTPSLTLTAGGAGAPSLPTGQSKSVFLQFVGRTVNGGKGSLYVFGTSAFGTSSPTNDYRITTVESSIIAAALVALTEVAPSFVGGDGSTMVWFPYANKKDHDHWVHKARTGL